MERRYAASVARSRSEGKDQMSLFAWRAREFSKLQPEFRDLRRILLAIGGEEAAPPMNRDPMINFMIDCGIVFSGPVVLETRRTGPPVTHLARAWRRRSRGLTAIGLGYALQKNGLWREHSFGILREGVLETESAKEKYFGLMLIGEAADGFVTGVLGRQDATSFTTDNFADMDAPEV